MFRVCTLHEVYEKYKRKLNLGRTNAEYSWYSVTETQFLDT